MQILKAYSSAVQSQKTVSSSKQILPFGFAGLPITLCSTTTTFVNIASIFVYYILFWNILIITVIIIIILLSARRFCTVNKQMYTKPLQLFSPYPSTLFYLNFQPLAAVSRYRDPQPQVVENYSFLLNFKPNIYKSCCLDSHFIPNNIGLNG